MKLVWTLAVSLFMIILATSFLLAQEAPEAVRGNGTFPLGDSAQGFRQALDAAIKDAVLNACEKIRGKTWVSLKRQRIDRELLAKAWDFVGEYRVVAHGKGSEGYFVVVDAQIAWDRLENAIALMDLPKLPAVMIRSDKSFGGARWSKEFEAGLEYGFRSKAIEVVDSPIDVEECLSVILSLSGEKGIKLEVKSSTGVTALVREFELTDEVEHSPYDAGVVLSNLIVRRMADENIIPKMYEFVVVASGVVEYSVIVELKRQLKLLGAVVVTEREVQRGRIVFDVVALRPKNEILSQLVAMGFMVGAE